MQEEIWKQVIGYEGLYEVSSHGRVKSMERVVARGMNSTYPVRYRILKPGINSKGYSRVNLCKDIVKTHQVHALVALAFIGPRPFGNEVCHNDGNPRNNYMSNLRYDTQAGNNADKLIHGTMAFGERSGTAVLSEIQVREIRALLLDGKASKDIAVLFQVSRPTISEIKKRRTWRHI